jgi:Zn-dependent protease with chaperone function
MSDGPPRVWQGIYYDGRTAARHPVTVTVMETGLRIVRGDDTFLWWPFDEIRQAAGDVPGEVMRLERGRNPVESLVVQDPGLAAAMAVFAPRAAGKVMMPMRGWRVVRLTLLAAGGAVLLGGVLYLWGIPALANTVAAHIPVAWEERLGAAVIEPVLEQTTRCAEPGGVAAIERIVRTLSASSSSPYTYRVTVVRVPQVNAFAAPGGSIVIFRGLLDKTPTPEALAGVISHEMQHVIQRHGTRNLIRGLSLRALIAMISGDGGLGRVLETGGALAALRYTRADEASADLEGLRMLQAARIDPQDIITFMETLLKQEGDLARPLVYLSNHPATGDRLAALRRRAAAVPYAPVPLLPDYPWTEISKICTR